MQNNFTLVMSLRWDITTVRTDTNVEVELNL